MKHFLPVFFILQALNFSAQNGFNQTAYTTSVTFNRFTNPAFDAAGHAWVAISNSTTITTDVMEYDGVNWITHTSPFSGITANKNNVIQFDANNNLWLGTSNGVAVFNGSTWTTYNTTNSSLVHNNVVSIGFEGSNVWLGTLGGLSKFDGTNWTNFTKTNSTLPSDSVWGISVDAPNDIWLSGKNYLTQYNGSTFTGYNYPGSLIRSVIKIGADHYVSTTAGVQRFNGVSFTAVSAKASSILNLPATYGATPPMLSEINNKPSFCYSKTLFSFHTTDTLTSTWYYPTMTLYALSLTQMSAREHPSNGKIYIAVQPASNKIGFLILDTTAYSSFGLGPAAGANENNYKFLDANYVKAGITNRGDKFWNLTNSAAYEVPKGSNKHANFAGAIWIGGLDNGGNLHLAAQTYRQSGNDFWPGPLDTISATIDTTTANAYDKTWKIDKQMIYDFQQNYSAGNVQNGSYPIPSDILTWPAHGSGNYSRNLAPFVDVNNNGIYDPFNDGDYPKIKGDQSLYMIFNDKLATHTETGSQPLGVEVHYEAYAFFCPTVHDSLKALNYTTFHDYTIINRSSYSYDSVYVGLWNDADLGYYADDLVSSNPAENFGMIFNGDGYDEPGGGVIGYDYSAPILSSLVINGPEAYSNDGIDNNNNGAVDEAGEKCLLTNFMTYHNNIGPFPPATLNPSMPDEYYNYCRSIWRDSTHLMDCGYQTGTSSNYYLPYPPYQTNPCGTQTPGDNRFISGIGPFALSAGQRVSITEALVFTQDTSAAFSPSDSTLFVRNVADVKQIRNYYSTNFPSCGITTGLSNSETASSFEIYPNPSQDIVTIRSSDKIDNVEITDVNGRVCYKSGNKIGASFLNFSVAGLSNGIYFVRINSGASAFRKLIVNR